MIEQIRLLEQLQQIDARIQQLEGDLAALANDQLRERLARMENMLAEDRAALSRLETEHGDRERTLKLEHDQLQKAKQKLQHVRNTKEYLAATRELDELRKAYADREQDVLALMEVVEKTRAATHEHDAALTELRAQVAEKDKADRERMAEIGGELAGLRGAREGLLPRLRPGVLKKYGVIRLKRGLAVVPVRGGTCQGCNMNIPPQLFNILQRGDDLHSCPTCHRIIYFEAAVTEGEAKQ